MKLQKQFIPIIALALFALLLALWAGLLRIGWTLPAFPNLSVSHGPLMISGFLGVLIPLERAVAIRQKWMFAVPVLAGIGWIGLLIVPFIGQPISPVFASMTSTLLFGFEPTLGVPAERRKR